MKTFTFISLGCKVNNYESNAINDLMAQNGYIRDDINPSVALINTCSVTAVADQKSRQHIRKLINTYPNAVIVAMGCYAQAHSDFVSDEIGAHIVIGTTYRNQIPALVEQYLKTGDKIKLVDKEQRKFKYEELGITSYQENARAYIKIEDGCDNFCTYCAIPYRRGKARSRDRIDILKEACSLVENGYKEIIVTGINVSYYGKDLEHDSFNSLISDLLSIKDLYRLRISSIELSDIDEELLNLVKRENFAKHFHIPLQSGSNTVLKRMNRKYDADTFYKKVEMIRSVDPDIAITADVITGFPGETEEEFNETVEFIKKCNFAMLHVFPYSVREGTAAARMPNQIDPKVKKERCLKLIRLSEELENAYQNKFVGKELEALIEQYDKKNEVFIGRTSNYLEVKIKNKNIKVGDIVKISYQK